MMRERILGTTRRLFYTRGIQAVGVDVIAAEVGISKRTLYNHFASKDDLIRSYLERWNQPAPAYDLTPAKQILAEFDRLEKSFSQPSFRGCPFVNAVAEAAQPSEAISELAAEFKKRRRSWFRAQLVELEVADPEALATQMMLLVDGAIATMLVQGDTRIAQVARDMAAVLLTAAGVEASAEPAGIDAYDRPFT